MNKPNDSLEIQPSRFDIHQMTEKEFNIFFNQIVFLKYQSIRASFTQGADEELLWQTCQMKLEEARDYLSQGRALFWGAFAGDEDKDSRFFEDSEKKKHLVGFLWAYPNKFFNEQRMFVNGFAVLKEFKRRRLATQLLEHLCGYCRNKGISTIYLQTAPWNTPAVKFYENAGFEPERLQLALHLDSKDARGDHGGRLEDGKEHL